MKANELRIGNILLIGDEIESVRSIELGRIEGYYINGEYGIALNIEPIPLTEDWLIKFGFTGDDSECSYRGVSIINIDGVFELFNHDFPVSIKSVHQLQNLYFAMTGEELTIKL